MVSKRDSCYFEAMEKQTSWRYLERQDEEMLEIEEGLE